MRLKKFWCNAIFLSFLLLPMLLASRKFDSFPSASLQAPTPPGEAPVFVHLFEWKWADVAQECENFLAPKGYGAVQVSPATEHVLAPGYPWWQRYQPISYKIDSRSGDRPHFAQMIARCHAVGVKVYADAVINHMAGISGGVGSAGSVFSKYNYPGLYQPSDFHTCKTNIKNYHSHKEVTQCELVGLADLDTRSPKVRRQIADYLVDLVHLGVDGLRIDAAKHIDTQDIAAIMQQVQDATSTKLFIYQEVIDPGNEAIRKREYYPNGRVIESEYGKFLGAKFLGIEGQNLSQLQTLGESWGLMPSEKAIVFIDNHDKQRGHGGGGTYLTYKNGKLYDLANVFMLAFPYGTPQVMSSYAFTDSNQGPPADTQGHTKAVYVNGQADCFGKWVCEHHHGAIAAMVKFRNQVAPDAPVTHWWSNGKNQIAFGRGNQGFVVINRQEQPLTQTFQTSLPAGQYCNLIAEPSDGCTSDRITVDAQGKLTVTVKGMEAIAIDVGARL